MPNSIAMMLGVLTSSWLFWLAVAEAVVTLLLVLACEALALATEEAVLLAVATGTSAEAGADAATAAEAGEVTIDAALAGVAAGADATVAIGADAALAVARAIKVFAPKRSKSPYWA